MATTPNDSEVRTRLLRLKKGALLVGVGGAYVGLLAGGLVVYGWRQALLAAFLIVLGQCFRYIAHDIDRLGWAMERAASTGEDGTENRTEDRTEDRKKNRYEAATSHGQTRMLAILGMLAILPSVAISVQAYLVGGIEPTAIAVVALALVEVLYRGIRRVNRQTAFRDASYGFRDKGIFGHGPDAIRALAETKSARVEQQLARLKAMADDGRISKRAYEKARDKYRVGLVMELDPP